MASCDAQTLIFRPSACDTSFRQDLLTHIKNKDTGRKPRFYMGRRARSLPTTGAALTSIPGPRPAKGEAGQRFVSETATPLPTTTIVDSALTNFGRKLGDFLRGDDLDADNDVEISLDRPSSIIPKDAAQKAPRPLQGRRVVVFYHGSLPDDAIDHIIDQGAIVALHEVAIPPARTQVRFSTSTDEMAAVTLASHFGAPAIDMRTADESARGQDIGLLLAR